MGEIETMKYGDFTESNKEFVMNRFDAPRPWMNVLFNDEYGLFFSQTGLGYSFYKEPISIPVTYIDIFTYVPQWPQTGKFIYLSDDQDNCWPLAPFYSDDKYDEYECRQHPGKSSIRTLKNGIESEFTIFVPRQDPLEIWKLRIKNRSDKKRTVKFFPFQELKLASYGSGITDTFTYIHADYNEQAQAIIAYNNNCTSKLIYGAFMASDYNITGYDCRLESFFGAYGRKDMPEAVLNGKCQNSSVSAERFCSVLSGEMTLEPGEEQTVHLIFGIGTEIEKITNYKEKYLTLGAPQKALDEVEAYWEEKFDVMEMTTPCSGMNALANVWYKHGTLFTSRYVRGSGHGYRDIIQDIMGVCPLDPSWTRYWLIESLKHMDPDGLPIRGYNVLGGDDDLRKHRDSGLWLQMTLSTYIRETGDVDILKEEVPFRDNSYGSVWEHIIRPIKKVASDVGAHGLCLIGDGDWNDSLNEINLEGKGESAWLTVACIYAADKAMEIARYTDNMDSCDELAKIKKTLTNAVNENAWDGEWYCYAFSDNGDPIGSHLNDEGQIHLNMQIWAIVSGVATGERLEKILKVIDETLDTKFGPVLIHPPYTKYTKGIGKASAKTPGHAENGPVYGHGVAFKLFADVLLGRGNKAFETFMKFSPFNPESNQDQYRGEPFAAQRYLVGPGTPEQFGAGWYPYFTATPTWLLMTLFERVLGVRPWYDGLIIDPVIPSDWTDLNVKRKWQGAEYDIDIVNPNGVERGVVELTIDGKKVKGNKLPRPTAGSQHKVICRMG